MMAKWKHLTYTDRLQIERLYNRGCNKKEIAIIVGCTLRTIYNEIPRGLYEHTVDMYDKNLHSFSRYSADKAQQDYDYKSTAKGRQLKIGKNHALVAKIEKKIIHEKFAPAAALKALNVTEFSSATLYSYIYKGIFPNLTIEHLPEKSGRKKKYHHVQRAAKHPVGTSIEKRPLQILERKEFGHWEMDSVIGKAKGKGQSLLVLTERMTRFELIFRLRDKSSRSVVSVLDGLSRKLAFSNIFKSITVDNGSEFANCFGMEHTKKGIKRTSVYYCHAFSSFERGSNERANRIIRRFIPKGTDLRTCTQEQCYAIANWMNNYPRRVLDWNTPAELVSVLCPDLLKLFEN